MFSKSAECPSLKSNYPKSNGELKGIINSKSEIKRKAEFASFHIVPLCDDSKPLCLLFPSIGKNPLSLTPWPRLFQDSCSNETSSVKSFQIWWGTNDGKIRHYVLHDMDVIH